MSPVFVNWTLRAVSAAALFVLTSCGESAPPAQAPESRQPAAIAAPAPASPAPASPDPAPATPPATTAPVAPLESAVPPAPAAQASPLTSVREAMPTAAPAATAAAAPPRRDLSKDEARGGHTIARHVGRSDQQLRDRLRAEPSLTVVSTYTDIQTAETTVEAAFRRSAAAIRTWSGGRGRRQNLAVDYVAPSPVGRSLRRGRQASSPCAQAVVVLRWDERRNDSYVLTSYPDCRP